MYNNNILGKSLERWIEEFPLITQLISTEEVFWNNPHYRPFEQCAGELPLEEKHIQDAEQRLQRFAPYLAKAFPETRQMNGIIESPLVQIPAMQQDVEDRYGQKILGQLWLKCDSHLPISGSIKARGGIYEVLKYAEDLAIHHNMLTVEEDYSILADQAFKDFFSQYSIAVGSTGNLGMSIGIISAEIGFHVTVHMSADAKQWKKDLLRKKGVVVVEYASDYSKAVEEGRKQSEQDPTCYFIDDENSQDLFLGYSVAASRLKKQLEDRKVIVDEDHPLFVYLPCGVGGGPGGVAYGLKLLYKDQVHCFFGEPTHSPCMLLGLMTGMHNKISVQDFGIDNITIADGLAVGRPSGFVGKTVEGLLSGIYTVSDDQLFELLRALVDTENIHLEPSALAGAYGAIQLFKSEAGHNYVEKHDLRKKLMNATHIIWATGGSMVPEDIMASYYSMAKS